MRDRESLIARIRQIRRSAEAAGEPANAQHANSESDQITALEARIAHLEQMLQGLQDSVHRESLRHGKRIAELEARVEPGALSQALSKNERERGL
jgi:uncharacterized coiled-coil protein SlyX